MEDASRHAAVASALGRLEPGMVIGLGSGRAVFALAEAIGQRWPQGVPIKAVVASPATKELAVNAGIPVIELDDDVHVSLAIDGSDELDSSLNLVKGGGAALLHEKLIIAAAEYVLIIAEAKKMVERLGSTHLLPIEIVRFGWQTTQHRVEKICDKAILRVTETGEPVTTAENNYLLDATIPDGDLHDIARALKNTLGVIEHGLFLDMANEAILGDTDGSITTLYR